MDNDYITRIHLYKKVKFDFIKRFDSILESTFRNVFLLYGLQILIY